MRLFGLIGNPLTHSFSKKYFNEKFEKEGLVDCQYELFPLESIEEFPALMRSNPALEGINVTIPYKKKILTYLDSKENIPAGLVACNCIQIKKGKLIGYNTDWIGFEKSILPHLQTHHKKALILGNGGATAAVAYALKMLGIHSSVVSRNSNIDSAISYKELNEEIIRTNSVIINTTPLGLYPNIDSCPDIPYHFISERHLLYDLVYNPAKTLFLQKGEERGAAIKNGEEMLKLQAEECWRIWNN